MSSAVETDLRAPESLLDFRDLLEAFPAAVYTTDADGRVTFFNRAAEELAGRTPQIGRDHWCVAWRLYRPDGTPLPFEECPMAVALHQRGPVRDVEVIAERPNGERIPLMPFPTPLFDAEGRVTGAVNMLVDISALKRAEAAAAKTAHEQAALYQFTDRLYRAENAGEVNEAALDAILSALRCSRASILLFDDAGVMQFVASRGLSAAYRKAVTGHSPWQPGQPQPEPICIEDVAAAALDDELKATIQGEGIGALAFIPLVADGGVVGKFMLYFDTPHVFTDDEVNLALTIARQMGFSIERSRVEASLRSSEERYRAVVESQAEMLCRFTPEGTIQFVNEAYARTRGTTAAALQGRNLWDFVAEADREAVRAQLDQLTVEAPEVRIENRFLTKDGERWTLWTNRALAFGADGRWTEAQSTGVDITERKRAEEALRESEERFRTIVETTPECVKLVAPDGTLLQMNTSGLGMVGADCFEVLEGASIYEVIAPEHRNRFKMFNERVCSGERGSLEFDIVGLSGVRRHMETHAVPFRNTDGAIVQLAVTRDVSERKRAEERQRKSDAEFRTLADNIHQFTWMTDSTGGIYWYNQRWFDYTGTTLEEMQGWGWQKVHHPEHVDRVVERFKACIESGEPWEDTFPLRGKDGEYRWFLSRALPIRDADGAIVRWFGTNTDITDRLRADEQRTLLINELNHRVKNTLAMVQSLAMQTLRNTERSEQARAMLDSRLAALSRAHDLLTSQNWEGASMREVVSRALAPFQLEDGRLRIDGPDVRVTPKQALSLSIALHELATNAAKYGAFSNAAGAVSVEWVRERRDDAEQLKLVWSERGGPQVTPPTHTGFGSRLIERNLAHDLAGVARINYHRDGVTAEINSPIEISG